MLNAQEIKKVKSILGGRDEGLSQVFDALSDPTRCHIFRAFLKKDPLCVSDIAKILDISMPLASQHLKILEVNGLLTKKRKGRRIYYTPNRSNSIVNAIIKAVN